MNKNQPGKLYLIPLPIAPHTYEQVIPLQVKQILHQIEHFLAENVRTARRYLSAMHHPQPIHQLHFSCLNKDTDPKQLTELMQPIIQGQDMGMLSEAGCPGIADPGALAVQYAHQHQIEVVPLVGPCSIVLALMASGLNGQNFVFHGYLPIRPAERQKAIQKLEKDTWQTGQTQIFIETPYRNQALLSTILEACQPKTLLCIGKDLTAQDGWIKTQSIQDWKKTPPNLHKIPTVLLLGKPALIGYL